jgi:hypothetical protein
MPETPDLGKYTPNYDMNKFVQSFYISKEQTKRKVKEPTDKDIICQRLLR